MIFTPGRDARQVPPPCSRLCSFFNAQFFKDLRQCDAEKQRPEIARACGLLIEGGARTVPDSQPTCWNAGEHEVLSVKANGLRTPCGSGPPPRPGGRAPVGGELGATCVGS